MSVDQSSCFSYNLYLEGEALIPVDPASRQLGLSDLREYFPAADGESLSLPVSLSLSLIIILRSSLHAAEGRWHTEVGVGLPVLRHQRGSEWEHLLRRQEVSPSQTGIGSDLLRDGAGDPAGGEAFSLINISSF